MKVLKSLLFVSAMALSTSLSFAEYKATPPPPYDCANVTFSCGATGYVCGHAGQSLLDRVWMLEELLCEN